MKELRRAERVGAGREPRGFGGLKGGGGGEGLAQYLE